jgi:hypothetical protein
MPEDVLDRHIADIMARAFYEHDLHLNPDPMALGWRDLPRPIRRAKTQHQLAVIASIRAAGYDFTIPH